jgi:crossover junction endonuclease MUS81
MKFILKVDHREGKLKECFDTWLKTQSQSQQSSLKFEVVYEQLEYGDFQLVSTSDDENQNETIHFLFERKTIDDLVASIKDGRYKNQKIRVLTQFAPSQCYYIIEGKLSYAQQTKPLDKIIHSAIINTQLRDKISCFVTSSISDTFALLIGIVTRVSEDPQKYCGTSNEGNVVERQTQSIVLTSNKSEVSDVFRAVLCQIPGISDKSATVFVERWGTFKAMYEELQFLESSKRTEVLAEMKGSNNRRLGKRTVEGILKHLFTVNETS